MFPHTKKAMISFKISDYFVEMKEQPNLPSSVKKIIISLYETFYVRISNLWLLEGNTTPLQQNYTHFYDYVP